MSKKTKSEKRSTKKKKRRYGVSGKSVFLLQDLHKKLKKVYQERF